MLLFIYTFKNVRSCHGQIVSIYFYLFIFLNNFENSGINKQSLLTDFIFKKNKRNFSLFSHEEKDNLYDKRILTVS